MNDIKHYRLTVKCIESTQFPGGTLFSLEDISRITKGHTFYLNPDMEKDCVRIEVVKERLETTEEMNDRIRREEMEYEEDIRRQKRFSCSTCLYWDSDTYECRLVKVLDRNFSEPDSFAVAFECRGSTGLNIQLLTNSNFRCLS